MENKVKGILKRLTNKKNIYLVKNCDTAIKFLIEDKDILIPDQGGWITYKQLPKQYAEIKTNYDLIDLNDLKNKTKDKDIFLINSLAGYFVEEPMKEIMNVCKDRCLVLNDVSGSLGRESARVGDFILGSFGKWKVVDLGYGGFIASDNILGIEEDFDKSKLEELYLKLKNINKRISFLDGLNKKVKNELKDYEVLHKESYSLNVIVEYKNLKEKEDLINYCKKNNYEFTLCPRYIRVNEEAISIELKRLSQDK